MFQKKVSPRSSQKQKHNNNPKQNSPPPPHPTWRIIPVSKSLGSPPFFWPFRRFGKRITAVRGLTNHGYSPYKSWDDPPNPQPRKKKTSKSVWSPFLTVLVCRFHLESVGFLDGIEGKLPGYSPENSHNVQKPKSWRFGESMILPLGFLSYTISF